MTWGSWPVVLVMVSLAVAGLLVDWRQRRAKRRADDARLADELRRAPRPTKRDPF
jgi:hypothetical protein